MIPTGIMLASPLSTADRERVASYTFDSQYDAKYSTNHNFGGIPNQTPSGSSSAQATFPSDDNDFYLQPVEVTPCWTCQNAVCQGPDPTTLAFNNNNSGYLTTPRYYSGHSDVNSLAYVDPTRIPLSFNVSNPFQAPPTSYQRGNYIQAQSPPQYGYGPIFEVQQQNGFVDEQSLSRESSVLSSAFSTATHQIWGPDYYSPTLSVADFSTSCSSPTGYANLSSCGTGLFDDTPYMNMQLGPGCIAPQILGNAHLLPTSASIYTTPYAQPHQFSTALAASSQQAEHINHYQHFPATSRPQPQPSFIATPNSSFIATPNSSFIATPTSSFPATSASSSLSPAPSFILEPTTTTSTSITSRLQAHHKPPIKKKPTATLRPIASKPIFKVTKPAKKAPGRHPQEAKEHELAVLRLREEGLHTYAQIKEIIEEEYGVVLNVSTFRGIQRKLIKDVQQRPRKPKWEERHYAALRQAIPDHTTITPNTHRLKVRWLALARHIQDLTGFEFGPNTCHKVYNNVVHREDPQQFPFVPYAVGKQGRKGEVTERNKCACGCGAGFVGDEVEVEVEGLCEGEL